MILVQKCYHYDGCDNIAIVENNDMLRLFREETQQHIDAIAAIKQSYNLDQYIGKQNLIKWSQEYTKMMTEIEEYIKTLRDPFDTWIIDLRSARDLSSTTVNPYTPNNTEVL